MYRRPRRNHSATFKGKVALAAVQGDKTRADFILFRHLQIAPKGQAPSRRLGQMAPAIL